MNSSLYSARENPTGFSGIYCCVFPPTTGEQPLKETEKEKEKKEKKKKKVPVKKVLNGKKKLPEEKDQDFIEREPEDEDLKKQKINIPENDEDDETDDYDETSDDKFSS